MGRGVETKAEIPNNRATVPDACSFLPEEILEAFRKPLRASRLFSMRPCYSVFCAHIASIQFLDDLRRMQSFTSSGDTSSGKPTAGRDLWASPAHLPLLAPWLADLHHTIELHHHHRLDTPGTAGHMAARLEQTQASDCQVPTAVRPTKLKQGTLKWNPPVNLCRLFPWLD